MISSKIPNSSEFSAKFIKFREWKPNSLAFWQNKHLLYTNEIDKWYLKKEKYERRQERKSHDI